MVNRTSTQIVGDLLMVTSDCGMEGAKTSALLTRANLSHGRLTKFLSNLTGSGLINKIEFDGKHTFVITEKGRTYLEEYKKFSDMAGSYGLDM